MSGYDITEGRASEAIAVDLGITAGTIWQNSGIDYDVAIGGIPFILDASDQHAYERSTAPFRKNQFCLLYTSDAADDLLCVDLGGRRIIKKKK